MEVVRNHETEEGGSVKLRGGLKASVKGYFGTDTGPIESRFPAQWPCSALSVLQKRKCAYILLLLLHYFTNNQMLKCCRSITIFLPRDTAFLSVSQGVFFLFLITFISKQTQKLLCESDQQCSSLQRNPGVFDVLSVIINESKSDAFKFLSEVSFHSPCKAQELDLQHITLQWERSKWLARSVCCVPYSYTHTCTLSYPHCSEKRKKTKPTNHC